MFEMIRIPPQKQLIGVIAGYNSKGIINARSTTTHPSLSSPSLSSWKTFYRERTDLLSFAVLRFRSELNQQQPTREVRVRTVFSCVVIFIFYMVSASATEGWLLVGDALFPVGIKNHSQHPHIDFSCV